MFLFFTLPNWVLSNRSINQGDSLIISKIYKVTMELTQISIYSVSENDIHVDCKLNSSKIWLISCNGKIFYKINL